MIDNYEPITRKIESWLKYDENKPKSKYYANSQEHDEYRRNNDLDCILTGGNLYADTIFSLWIPLRFVLVRINGYSKLNKYGKVGKNIPFLKKISPALEQLLPTENETVKKLIELFELGQQRCNVMILRDRQMQSRGDKPYFDYMPYFLHDCFDNGKFSKYFSGNDDLIEWIHEQKLDMFFTNNEISKNNIIDLSGSGDIKKGVPLDMNVLLDNYINILNQRKKLVK
jgi:hypothetical protein